MKVIADIKNSLGSRQVRFGGYAALLTIALAAVIVLANLVVQGLDLKFDLTANQLFSLTEQSKQVAAAVQSPIKIYVLHEPGREPLHYTQVLGSYAELNNNISVEVRNPDREPALIQKYRRGDEAIGQGSVIVEGEKGFRVIRSSDIYDVSYRDPQNPQITGFALEKRVTSAIGYVSTGTTPVVYELVGKNETPLADFGIQPIIERENFELRQLSLIRERAVPADAAVLILGGPKADLTQGEADKILAWLNEGGRLLVMADFQTGAAPVLNDLLASYGIGYQFGVVVEMDQNFSAGNPFLLRPAYGAHDIMRSITSGQLDVILHYAIGISTSDTRRRTVEVEPLLRSSHVSFLRQDLRNDSPSKTDTDLAGPVTVGVAVKDVIDFQSAKEARIVVLGTGSLLAPMFPFGQLPGNQDLFMNSLAWLNDRKETITVASKSLMTFPMRLSEIDVIVFAALFVIIVPLALFIAGLMVWLRRRHL